MKINLMTAVLSLAAFLSLGGAARAETVVCTVANTDAASGVSTMTFVGEGSSFSMQMPLDFSNAQADGSRFSLSSKPHVVNVTTSDDKSTKTFEFKYSLRQHRPGQPTSIVTGDWYLILNTASPADSKLHRTYGVRIAFPTCIGYWQCQTIRQDMELSAAQCSVSPNGRSGD